MPYNNNADNRAREPPRTYTRTWHPLNWYKLRRGRARAVRDPFDIFRRKSVSNVRGVILRLIRLLMPSLCSSIGPAQTIKILRDGRARLLLAIRNICSDRGQLISSFGYALVAVNSALRRAPKNFTSRCCWDIDRRCRWGPELSSGCDSRLVAADNGYKKFGFSSSARRWSARVCRLKGFLLWSVVCFTVFSIIKCDGLLLCFLLALSFIYEYWNVLVYIKIIIRQGVHRDVFG